MNQPKGNAPVSRDVVEVVKQKLAPPRGPPPKGMTNFKAPKEVTRKPYMEQDPNVRSADDEEDDGFGPSPSRAGGGVGVGRPPAGRRRGSRTYDDDYDDDNGDDRERDRDRDRDHRSDSRYNSRGRQYLNSNGGSNEDDDREDYIGGMDDGDRDRDGSDDPPSDRSRRRSNSRAVDRGSRDRDYSIRGDADDRELSRGGGGGGLRDSREGNVGRGVRRGSRERERIVDDRDGSGSAGGWAKEKHRTGYSDEDDGERERSHDTTENWRMASRDGGERDVARDNSNRGNNRDRDRLRNHDRDDRRGGGGGGGADRGGSRDRNVRRYSQDGRGPDNGENDESDYDLDKRRSQPNIRNRDEMSDDGTPTPRNGQSQSNHHQKSPARGSAEGKGLAVAAVPAGGVSGLSLAQPPPHSGGKHAKTVLFNYQPILRATYRELKHFVTSPSQPGFTTRCYIERSRSYTKMLAPFYSLCADLEDGTGRELMVCRKILKSRTPHYIFSLKSEDLWRKREQRSRLFLGKLRAISATDYVLFDNGITAAPDNDDLFEDEDLQASDDEEDDDDTSATAGAAPGKRGGQQAGIGRGSKEGPLVGGKGGGAKLTDDVSLYRKQLAVIHFNTKHRPAPQGVRGSEICIPHPDAAQHLQNLAQQQGPANAEAKNGLSSSSSSSTNPKTHSQLYNITKPFEKARSAGKQNEMYSKTTFVLHERTSRYDPLSSCLVDFKGRANMASVKNCQFVESSPTNLDKTGSSSGADSARSNAEREALFAKPDAEKDFILQLGKTTDDCFNMDYRHPLSLLQAFAISVARFDAKLSW